MGTRARERVRRREQERESERAHQRERGKAREKASERARESERDRESKTNTYTHKCTHKHTLTHSLSLSLGHTHMQTHKHTFTRTHTRTHTHLQCGQYNEEVGAAFSSELHTHLFSFVPPSSQRESARAREREGARASARARDRDTHTHKHTHTHTLAVRAMPRGSRRGLIVRAPHAVVFLRLLLFSFLFQGEDSQFASFVSVIRHHRASLRIHVCDVTCSHVIPQLNQFRRGISGGPALKYFHMIHRSGRMCVTSRVHM